MEPEKKQGKRAQLPQLTGPRVPQETIDKVPTLVKAVAPLGYPRVHNEDIVGALIDAATPAYTAEALRVYNVKLGQAIAALEAATSEDGASSNRASQAEA
jgi:hypothetical protein